MRKYKYIKKYVGDPLKSEGFRYDGFESGGIWTFCRRKGDVTQSVRICQERFLGNMAEVILSTDAYGQLPKTIAWSSYDNEEEFEAAAKKFYEKIKSEGLELLEKMSVPVTEIRPTAEAERYLFENHEELCWEYKDKLQIGDRKAEGMMEKIITFMKEHENENFETFKRDLIGIAAVYGGIYEEKCQAKWRWYDEGTRTWMEIGNKACYPLEEIIFCWRDREYDFLWERYQYVIS